MSLPTKLAKLTAKSMSLQPGSGGLPELTREMVAGALGYASTRIPGDRTGVHLVLAKYTADEVSRGALEKSIPVLAWEMWYELECAGPITVKMISNIARLAIKDFCEPGFTQAMTDAQLAQAIGTDYRTWRKRYHHIYAYLVGAMYQLEGPVLSALSRALQDPDDESEA